MAQQTAVEWLWRWQMDNEFASFEQGISAYRQAKAMEKEQIELAYKNGANDEFEHWMNNEERKTSIGYYKRAYKK